MQSTGLGTLVKGSCWRPSDSKGSGIVGRLRPDLWEAMTPGRGSCGPTPQFGSTEASLICMRHRNSKEVAKTARIRAACPRSPTPGVILDGSQRLSPSVCLRSTEGPCASRVDGFRCEVGLRHHLLGVLCPRTWRPRVCLVSFLLTAIVLSVSRVGSDNAGRLYEGFRQCQASGGGVSTTPGVLFDTRARTLRKSG
jgi:hypothetical protein